MMKSRSAKDIGRKTRRAHRQLIPGVTVDPDISFGRPCVARNVPTEGVASRYIAGESIAELVDDYQISEASIRRALRYERVVLREQDEPRQADG